MTVPTRHVRRKIASHAAIFDNYVLQNLVERMPNVNRPICIRRPVVQNKRLSVLVLLEHLVIQIRLVPARQTLRLVLRQPRLHLKRRLGQIHRMLVIWLFRSLFLFFLRHNPYFLYLLFLFFCALMIVAIFLMALMALMTNITRTLGSLFNMANTTRACKASIAKTRLSHVALHAFF